MANTFKLITSTTVTNDNSVSSVSFTSIPQTYTDLVIKIKARTTEGGAGYEWATGTIRFNSDSSSNYRYQLIYSYFSTSGPNATNKILADGGTTTGIDFAPNNNGTLGGDALNTADVYINNYTASSNIPVSVETNNASMDSNQANATNAQMAGYIWVGTGPLTSITLTPASTKYFMTNSIFYLYGISKS